MNSKFIFTLFLPLLALLISCQTKAQVNNFKPVEVFKKDNNLILIPANESQSNLTENIEANSKIGTIQSGKQSVCLRIENPNLKIGEKIQIIIAELPQNSIEAEISEKSPCKESFGHLDAGDVTDYLLKSVDEKFLSRGYGIGVATAQKAQMKGKFATLDIDGDGKVEYFRECTSMEGLHLTVWKGKPLVGKGVWNAYYGVGYDTVPTCKKNDFYGNDE